MLGCDCGGTKYDEEHADDCAGWRLELAAERAAHLATRKELSVALAERAHARAEVEMHKGLRAETLKANENLRAEVERLRAERRALAERMREACAKAVDDPHYSHLKREAAIERIRATPLVTEETP